MFFIFFVFSILLGFLAFINPNRYSILLVIYICLVPSSASFSHLNLKEGIYFYDGIFVGLFLALPFIANVKDFLYKRWEVLFLFSVLILYFVTAMINNAEFKYVLKDLRPFILILEFFLIINLIVNRFDRAYSTRTLIKVVVGICFFTFIKLLLQQQFAEVGGDEFYETNQFRYLDAVAYMGSFFLVFLFLHRKMTYLNTSNFILLSLVMFVPIAIANARVLIVAIAAGLIFDSIKNGKFGRTFISILFSTAIAVGFYLVSIYLGSERVLEALNVNILLFQIETRFSPALELMYDFSWYNYLIGLGVGIPFEIPWFDYRGTIEPFNANIDSFYLTLYCKYGILMIPLLLVVKRLVVSSCIGALDSTFYSMLMVIFFVSATFYQIYSIGLIMCFFFMKAFVNAKH